MFTAARSTLYLFIRSSLLAASTDKKALQTLRDAANLGARAPDVAGQLQRQYLRGPGSQQTTAAVPAQTFKPTSLVRCQRRCAGDDRQLQRLPHQGGEDALRRRAKDANAFWHDLHHQQQAIPTVA
jgi:hypothetical protein